MKKLRNLLLIIILMFTSYVNCATFNKNQPPVCPETQNQSMVDEKGLNYHKTDSSKVMGSTVVLKYSSKSNFTNIMFDEKTTNNIERTINNSICQFITSVDNSTNKLNEQINNIVTAQQERRNSEAQAHLVIFSIFVLIWFIFELIFRRADVIVLLTFCRAVGSIALLLSAYYIGIII